LEHVPSAIILRPSIVFGPEDNFFNQFARMAQLSPALPLIGGGKTLFQPVYVADVAEAFAKALAGELQPKKVYELGGPEVMSFKQVLEYICKEIRRSPVLLPLPWMVSSALGIVGNMIPGKPITDDQVEMLKTDNVVSAKAQKAGLTLEGMGINPTSIEAIVPSYLYSYRKGGQFADTTKGLS
jgi:NADH dehydrogenase